MPSPATSDRRAAPPGADRRRVARGGRRPTDEPGLHPTILVAEHDDRVRRPCVRYFTRFRFHVTEADHGDAVLAKVHATPPVVIVTELRLPRLPAWRMSQWLADDARTRDIPVIVLADDLEGEDTRRVLDSAAGLLIKPFPLPTMLAEVRRVLRAQG